MILIESRIYIARLLECLMLSIGLYLIFNPIAVLLSFIPYLSGMISNFFFIIAMLLGFLLGSLIISIAWVLHHPEYMTGSSYIHSYISFIHSLMTFYCVALLIISGVLLILAGSILAGEHSRLPYHIF